ncbi:ammonia-forming cytochrome c nitrite reductase subunit c552 [Anaeromyxobacter oryzae]|uniref:nitrite reductase (cytochrome; ammonia-forming) n=1 Tax=Anaeromyxobacter oryzae TaxID=2918170 RepID=A0ABM7WYR0_9BACT|nr:ammonia-forming cytochrome c nitrite reductase subunit c552 [Anaeromyxobacter oryzae]BDG04615.1 cytochrome c-552 [Anaeromyxobacter oryzae]
MTEKTHLRAAGIGLAALLAGTTLAAGAQTKEAAPRKTAPAAKKGAKPAEKKVAPKPAITEDTEDPAIWGQEYPLEYETYLKTVDQVRTKYGGSEALPRTPDEADPRSVVSQEKIEEDPRLKTMWAGYAFSVDFREERGHAYMLEDQTFTKRQAVVKQPGSCMQCHASTVIPYRKLGDGDPVAGFHKMNAMAYMDARKLVSHPVACIDCHDPATMQLRVTKPGFMEGIRAWKESQGVKDYDVNKQASQKEMRAFVCGQCHVEYYFKGSDKQLTYPWANGIQVDQIQDYYDRIAFKDWVHKITGAPVLKAQHPEFEMWNQGIHGRSGVTCVDCHMPEITYKGQKITDHQVNSPLLKIQASCTRCHADVKPDELKARVEREQDRFFALRNTAMDSLMLLISDLEKAKAGGKTDEQLVTPRYLQRRAQFYLDFVEAENSTGFHAPQEALRILAQSIDYSRQGQLAIRDPSFKPTVAVVSVPTAAPGPNQSTAPAAPGAPAQPLHPEPQPAPGAQPRR